MITFKQFITEARAAPLYHGTDLRSLASIIDSNILRDSGYSDARPNHPQLKNKITVSLSRNLKFAEMWGKRMHWWSDATNNPVSAVIQLNQAKLATNYKIYPYNHFPYENTRALDSKRYGSGEQNHTSIDRNQYEERIIGSVKNLDRYIEKIIMSPEARDKFQLKYPDAYNIAVKKGWL